MKLRIGSRGSVLALWQAHHVRDRLLGLGHEVEVKVITTTGDRLQDRRLESVGGKGAFLKEIEEAMLAGEVDLAVHSLKDMTSEIPSDLMLACIPEREDPRDAFVGNGFQKLFDLPPNSRIGTSSLRRSCQIREQRPDLHIVQLRGKPWILGKGEFAEMEAIEGKAIIDAKRSMMGPATEIDGDEPVEIMAGVLAVRTPGHTAGHISLVVQTEDGRVLIAGDQTMTRSEYEDRRFSQWYGASHLEQLNASLDKVMAFVKASQRVLDSIYRPDGYNIGMNLGKAAGAGIEQHIHMHVVPRWVGDANFVSVIGETRVIPEDLQVTFEKIARQFEALE